MQYQKHSYMHWLPALLPMLMLLGCQIPPSGEQPQPLAMVKTSAKDQVKQLQQSGQALLGQAQSNLSERAQTTVQNGLATQTQALQDAIPLLEKPQGLLDTLKSPIDFAKKKLGIGASKQAAEQQHAIAVQQAQTQQAMLNQLQLLQQQQHKKPINIKIIATPHANADPKNQGMATVMLFQQLTDSRSVETLGQDQQMGERQIEHVVLPNRTLDLTTQLTNDMQFLGFVFQLRQPQHRWRLAIPIQELNPDQALTLEVGACDIRVTQGLKLPLSTTLKQLTDPLKPCKIGQ
ncbi:MAG: type VI secretion lipoprotein TssJ [Pseudomonadota bacterium]|nr:type VI secretion lipoprotein TssJ [Pseudomonadota bacterium]